MAQADDELGDDFPMWQQSPVEKEAPARVVKEKEPRPEQDSPPEMAPSPPPAANPEQLLRDAKAQADAAKHFGLFS